MNKEIVPIDPSGVNINTVSSIFDSTPNLYQTLCPRNKTLLDKLPENKNSEYLPEYHTRMTATDEQYPFLKSSLILLTRHLTDHENKGSSDSSALSKKIINSYDPDLGLNLTALQNILDILGKFDQNHPALTPALDWIINNNGAAGIALGIVYPQISLNKSFNKRSGKYDSAKAKVQLSKKLLHKSFIRSHHVSEIESEPAETEIQNLPYAFEVKCIGEVLAKNIAKEVLTAGLTLHQETDEIFEDIRSYSTEVELYIASKANNSRKRNEDAEVVLNPHN